MGRGGPRPRAENPHPYPRNGPAPAKPPASATACCCASRKPKKTRRLRHRGRVIKIIDQPKHRVLGIFRALPNGGGRLEPVDKKMLGKEFAIPPGATGDAQDGDLVAVETQRAPRLGLAHRPRGRAARLAQIRARRQPDRHPRPRHPARLPPRDAERSRSRQARDHGAPRGLARVPLVTIDPPDAKDHDDAVHAEPDTAANNRGGFIVTVAIADVAHYVTPGSALDREALMRGNSVYFPDRVVPMLPERISNDLCSLRPHEDRAALAVRMVIGSDGRKRSHTFHRVMMRSAAQLSYEQAQLAIDGRTDEVTEPLIEPILAPLYAAYEAWRARATSASRWISICPSARSCSRPTAPSTASSRRSGWRRTG